MTRADILREAVEIVCGERESQYGSPEDNFKMIADLWSAYMGIPVYPKDVSCMMMLLKIARIASGNAKMDNYIDIAGYAACGGEIECIQASKEVCHDK